LGAFKCLKPRLGLCGLIAFLMLINPKLPMAHEKKLVFMRLGPKSSNFHKLDILIVNLEIFLCMGLVN
jgi:hypothetical protein